ncbi:hypothetical protein ACPRNU_25745, partial [Chromobacterium vaccinii]|uniref:hypothetical protein n=1 Tax=Chromobacterium vaccinii TaxID=1108595 RepID=UPI003C783FE9
KYRFDIHRRCKSSHDGQLATSYANRLNFSVATFDAVDKDARRHSCRHDWQREGELRPVACGNKASSFCAAPIAAPPVFACFR